MSHVLAGFAKGRRLGVETLKAKADEAYADLLPDMVAWRESGVSLREMADRLNRDGQTTRTGKPFAAGTVANVLRRQSAL